MKTIAQNTVPFTKANGCGNDFLIIDAAHAPADIALFTQRLCNRHSGIGADGVEWIYPESGDEADVRARLINSDGSEAEISGNGTRCVAAYWRAKTELNMVRVRTGAGIKTCVLVSSQNYSYDFSMEMGEPRVEGEISLALEHGPVSGVRVSTGNPHFVVVVRDFDFNWQHLGGEIQSQREFPEGVNVEFVRVLDRNTMEARFFERGAGETNSSGTGSCASAVAAIHMETVNRTVSVIAPGGTQRVTWEGNSLRLEGPAELVCQGEFFI